MKALLTATLGLGLLAAPALAIPVSGIVHEGGVPLDSSVPAADIVLGDFNQDASDPTLEVVGDVSIYGAVAHRTTTLFNDSWTMDFGTESYDATFNWYGTTDEFDGQILVDGVSTELDYDGTLDLGTLTGVVTFAIDPIFGMFDPVERAQWNIHFTQTAAIPLPAGGVLLLTGLMAFAVARRRA
ncbi:MAG: VPLPA-CTERM sorting domain-containing protein [Pseudomonadota bacterium]